MTALYTLSPSHYAAGPGIIHTVLCRGDVACRAAGGDRSIAFSRYTADTRQTFHRGGRVAVGDGSSVIPSCYAAYRIGVFRLHASLYRAAGDSAIVLPHDAANTIRIHSRTCHAARYRAILDDAPILSRYGTYIGRRGCYVHIVQCQVLHRAAFGDGGEQSYIHCRFVDSQSRDGLSAIC